MINEAVTFQSLGVNLSYPLKTEVRLYVELSSGLQVPVIHWAGVSPNYGPWNSTFVASDLGLFQASELSA